MKYLDFGGLVTFWNKLKEYFVTTESYEEDTLVVAAALTDLNERKLDAADLPSWAKQLTKPSYNLDEIADGTTNKAYTATEKTKLAGIEGGAEANVKPDWNAVSGSDAEILNKPLITYDGTAMDIGLIGKTVCIYGDVDINSNAGIRILDSEGGSIILNSSGDGDVAIHGSDGVAITSSTGTNVTVTPGGTGKLLYKGNEVLTTSNLNSPALAGTPTAPTATAGTNTTQLATTAFVQGEISSQLGNIETLLAAI